MAYCTLDDILLRYPYKDIKELTNDDSASPSINLSRVNAAINDSSELIDSKIHKRYVVPLSPVPPRIKRVAVEIATYYIYKLRYDSKLPEQIDISYKDAVSYLEALRTGDEELVGIDFKEGHEFIFLTDLEQLTGSITNEEFNSI